MKLLYKPFSIFAHSIATKLGKTVFEGVWASVGEGEKPPSPTSGRRSLVEVGSAAALEAATMAAVGAVVDQLTARAFHSLVGAWPDKPKDEKQAAE